MDRSATLSFEDPLCYQAAITTANFEVLPTSGSSFKAELTKVHLGELLLQRFFHNLPTINTGFIKPGRSVLTFLTSSSPASMRHCGMTVSSGNIIVNDSDEIHQQTEAEFRLGSISLEMSRLDAASQVIAGCDLFSNSSQRQLVRPDAAMMSRLLDLHEIVGQMAANAPEILLVNEAARSLENQFIHLLVRCLTESASSRSINCGLRQARIIAKFHEYLEANPNVPLYLGDICGAIGAAERSLRAACEIHLGMGPIRYLALRRMHLVRRALLQAGSSTTTVTGIAMEHGFWELGRFSVNYRAMFGETPSATLFRATARPTLQMADVA
ncbi:helix-turn-helix domain-containing protein [Bradyrhizobium sp. GCM10028915]|uniref:helix-turn-helix domain-containing protein n=1 Tax=unclassified Bradyrhizobium TaxID=2631580 RepID=UPI003613CEE4